MITVFDEARFPIQQNDRDHVRNRFASTVTDHLVSKNAKLAFVFWGCTAAIWVTTKLAILSGLRINHTPSLPIGVWSVSPLKAPLQRGQIVSFCPPDRPIFRDAVRTGILGQGNCRTGWEPMLKPVIAVPGDRVEVRTSGLLVNDKAVPNSARLTFAIPMIEPGIYSLRQGEFWVVSTSHPRSFDSRYFGPVPIDGIEGLAKPVLIWPRNRTLVAM